MSPHMLASRTNDNVAEGHSSSKSKCPYYNTNNNTSPPDDADTSSLTSSLQSLCPAFENGTCPFASVADDEDKVKSMLLQLPASHHDPGALQHVLQGILVGNDVASTTSHHVQLCAAMEQYSLASMIQHYTCAVLEQDEVEGEAIATPNDDAATRSKSSSPPLRKEPTSPTTNRPQLNSLSVSFKEGTAASHQAAENVHFVRNFVQGQIDRELYGKMLVQLYYVYDALETALLSPHSHVPESLTAFHHQLVRTPALLEDLSYWLGIEDPAHIPPPSPATLDYTQRIQQCAATADDGMTLVAHAYTRYMGDLSGGRVLQRVVQRVFGKQAATDFYTFATIPSVKVFKDQYRAALDAVPCDITAAVAEANLAFVLNMRLFEELDVWARVPGASVRPWDVEALERERVARMVVAAQPGASANANECPFIQKKQQKEQQPTKTTSGRCPWPFILLHDPVAAMADWQTWAVLGLLACYFWSLIVASKSSSSTYS